MSIYLKLLEVQKEVGTVSKTSTNPFFKSKYFCINKLIEVVTPVLSNHGLVLLQPIENNKVISRIIDSETGESCDSSIELPNLTDPQKLGSAITYYRRYTLQSLLSLQAEDDDGNKASKAATTQKPQISIDDKLNIAKKDISECKSIAALQEVWKLNSDLQKDESFKKAKDSKKEYILKESNKV